MRNKLLAAIKFEKAFEKITKSWKKLDKNIFLISPRQLFAS